MNKAVDYVIPLLLVLLAIFIIGASVQAVWHETLDTVAAVALTATAGFLWMAWPDIKFRKPRP